MASLTQLAGPRIDFELIGNVCFGGVVLWMQRERVRKVVWEPILASRMVCRCTLCTFPFYESLFIWDNSALAVLHSELELGRRKMHRSNCLKWKNSWRRTNRAFVTSRWHQDEGELTYHIFPGVQCFPSRDWMIESLCLSISISVFNDRLGRQCQFLAASWKLRHQGNCNSRGQRRRACNSLQCAKSASCFECQAYIPTPRCLSLVKYGIQYTTIATNLGQIQATYVHT